MIRLPVSRATHEAALAAKDDLADALHAELWKADDTIAALRRQLADATERHKVTETDACNLASECNRLCARLAKFDHSTRQRDARGHFVKDA